MDSAIQLLNNWGLTSKIHTRFQTWPLGSTIRVEHILLFWLKWSKTEDSCSETNSQTHPLLFLMSEPSPDVDRRLKMAVQNRRDEGRDRARWEISLSGQTAVLIWSQKVTQHQAHQTIWARCHSVLGIPIPISLAFWASPVGDAQNADHFDFA